MNRIQEWWRQPDRYDWLSTYLESQQLRRPLQVLMAVTAATCGVVPIILYWSNIAPRGPIENGAAATASVVCAAMVVVWLSGWPSRRASRVFALGSTLSVAAASFTTTPQFALVSCVTFAAIAGLVALTHTSPFLATVLGIAIVTTVTSGVRLAQAGDVALALCQTLLILVAIHIGPTFGQILVQLLGADAVRSDVDALTGLRNRRGFFRATTDRLALASSVPDAHLGIVMIDLDNFKRINDTQGHAAGDDVLASVADVLRRMSGADAVVARIGGEEFCISLIARATRISALAHVVCAAVQEMPNGVTASVGAVAHRLLDIPDGTIIDRLMNAADDAMYVAKRSGGDRVHLSDHCGWATT